MIIDMEHQMTISPRGKGKNTRKLVDGKVVFIKGSVHSSVEANLEFMDKAGIDMAMISPGGSDLDSLKRSTDAVAKVVKQYPKRFIAFASVLPFGGKPAFDEMERAIKDLGMKGIHITARPEGQLLDSKELWPFYEKVSELGVPIDVHIWGSGDYDATRADYGLSYVLTREFDICAATFRICLGGVMEDFPDLVFIVNHFGGGISAVMERFDVYLRDMGDSFYPGKPLISKPWREYFNKLYFSIAGREIGVASLKCALTTISPKKIMFATDWPWNFEDNPQDAKKWVEEIRKLGLSKSDTEGILGGNAAKLLGI